MRRWLSTSYPALPSQKALAKVKCEAKSLIRIPPSPIKRMPNCFWLNASPRTRHRMRTSSAGTTASCSSRRAAAPVPVKFNVLPPAWPAGSAHREDQRVEAPVGQDDEVEGAGGARQEREGEAVETRVETPVPPVEGVCPAEHGGDCDRCRPPRPEGTLGHDPEVASVQDLGARRGAERTHHAEGAAKDGRRHGEIGHRGARQPERVPRHRETVQHAEVHHRDEYQVPSNGSSGRSPYGLRKPRAAPIASKGITSSEC